MSEIWTSDRKCIISLKRSATHSMRLLRWIRFSPRCFRPFILRIESQWLAAGHCGQYVPPRCMRFRMSRAPSWQGSRDSSATIYLATGEISVKTQASASVAGPYCCAGSSRRDCLCIGSGDVLAPSTFARSKITIIIRACPTNYYY